MRNLLRGLGMMTFLFGEVAQELADAYVGRTASGRFIKALGFELHQLGLFLNRLEAQRPH